MAKALPPINDNSVYTQKQIAQAMDRSERWAKEFIRANVAFADLGNGLLAVSGRLFREAIERMSDPNN
ncbi:hypothetical protein [Rhodopirellula bahusiensis]|uniref:Uncharacterized protein n=1 Tax=Rhodopirellula bahusiensis TaxID=2014065 RepID=A0A2G1W6E5_9BACT|nr:hypothetical protein [Rhodopirellula bahusiensis]PHQ34581.1 hypothetical protein CEE69_14295 [Rhodopirellula bahusiensis]